MDSITMQDFIDLIKLNINHNKELTIVEVGSLNGDDSTLLKNTFPNSQVHTIEALPDNYENYIKNNELINSYNIAITDYNGVTNFHVKNINGIHGILNRGDEYGTKVIQIPCMTLDTFCDDNNIENIDILKIDVEGSIYEVLKGMENILSKVGIMHIETEFHEFFKNQKLHDEVEKILIDNNFKLLKITYADILKDKKQSDSVWINKNI